MRGRRDLPSPLYAHGRVRNSFAGWHGQAQGRYSGPGLGRGEGYRRFIPARASSADYGSACRSQPADPPPNCPAEPVTHAFPHARGLRLTGVEAQSIL
jgi:hypothetical protein